MEIGIGLPTTVPGAKGKEVLEWARRAESAGFSTLGTLDRLVYPNYEPLVALGAAAAVTERVRLMTAIAILPYRANAALVAKQAGHDPGPVGRTLRARCGRRWPRRRLSGERRGDGEARPVF